MRAQQQDEKFGINEAESRRSILNFHCQSQSQGSLNSSLKFHQAYYE